MSNEWASQKKDGMTKEKVKSEEGRETEKLFARLKPGEKFSFEDWVKMAPFLSGRPGLRYYADSQGNVELQEV